MRRARRNKATGGHSHDETGADLLTHQFGHGGERGMPMMEGTRCRKLRRRFAKRILLAVDTANEADIKQRFNAFLRLLHSAPERTGMPPQCSAGTCTVDSSA